MEKILIKMFSNKMDINFKSILIYIKIIIEYPLRLYHFKKNYN